ncbi:hypothetical protein CINF_1644 [Candidatus Campylobacter infans]|uniref:Uncharacterized protein n=1 Tax=Candidatus Campylobacter infans TaxID=2561898 RepID=A0A7H9CJ18_9BACT|nr:hypothetical protein [Candidatus Campylobacter infans]QLI06117.1 hypothetical protein CINF_1644 [Candidatus Campylobacter infans]
MNIEEILDTLHSASDEISILEEELNAKAKDELAELIDRDYEISVDVSYTLYSREFSITLYYIKQSIKSKSRYLTIDCELDKTKIVISTTTTDAQKIKKLTEFCERHILGGFDDEFVEY